jgi:hypothetical protein
VRSLFEPEAVQEVMRRIEQLKPSSQRRWGKMDVTQMMAHCSAALEMASGKFVAKRTLLGRIIGPRIRHVLTDVELAQALLQPFLFVREIPAADRGRRIKVCETSSPTFWEHHAFGVEHGHVQTHRSSPEAI